MTTLGGEDEVPMPEVKTWCLRCHIEAEQVANGRVLVSPTGKAHHSSGTKGGDTWCGLDATGPEWWWPL